LYCLAAAICIIGCEQPFDTSKLPNPASKYVIGDTSYVEIYPPFEGFSEPSAILIGYDQLLFVADTKKNRVVLMNTAGEILSERYILQPISLGEDYLLKLFVGGSVIEASGDTVGAIFRLNLPATNHDLEHAPMDTIWKEVAKPRRRFTGLLALPGNDMLAVRRGPDNTSYVDPDGRILRFNSLGKLISPLGDFVTRSGSGITDINFPTGIGGFQTKFDFVLLQSSEGVAYGALWMVYESNPNFEGWLPKFDPADPDQRLVDFVKPNRFIEPRGCVVDGKRGDIFIADMAQDSIFKFDSRGRFKKESFGYVRSEQRMVRPVGLAFFDKTLYVLDAGTNRILRYKQSYDF